MIEITNTMVEGFEPAVRGMRNSWNSWKKSDSDWCSLYSDRLCKGCVYDGGVECLRFMNRDCEKKFFIGKNDLALMKKLVKAGTDHRKFLRMITVWCDITAPLYWWAEADTYKVGTVANSCSTMHCIADKEFTVDDFSHEYLIAAGINSLERTIEDLNSCREGYLNEAIKENPEWHKETWWPMIQLLPSSYNQKRTVMLNYEVLINMYKARKNHKLDEWREFCKWVEKLPYMKELLEV